ncbi:YrhK-like protein [Glaciihabitans tibetensis]|uniref:YrhK-like protein n=1 Tax=Glaciihabitans tibetensis TaxID=1266600 RepID=A0A2T0VA09_9MICO|nr:YrhK family protein [Glaciihabitans tibetensis]PRY66981.1 YrhK-like protein [Glaciihabitans tibetensis]
MPAPRALRLRREAWGFAIGSGFFLVGAVPLYADAVGLVATNVTFFVGAIFFTLAAFIQLALSGRPPGGGREPGGGRQAGGGWSKPDRYDWWASVVQFGGTLFFNLSTTQALLIALNPSTRVNSGWRPDAFGSLLFLVASVCAVLATTQRDALWDPNARVWRCTWLNLLGSVFFAISAVGAYVLPASKDLISQFWANAGTFFGAACFLIAALLSRAGATDRRDEPRSAA